MKQHRGNAKNMASTHSTIYLFSMRNLELNYDLPAEFKPFTKVNSQPTGGQNFCFTKKKCQLQSKILQRSFATIFQKTPINPSNVQKTQLAYKKAPKTTTNS